jgi:hypothetical protein
MIDFIFRRSLRKKVIVLVVIDAVILEKCG